MFKIMNAISRRKKPQLKMSVSEYVRDYIIKSGVESVKDAAYISGNNTEKILKVAEMAKTGLETVGAATGGIESAGALGNIVYKTTKDLDRGG